MCRNTEQSCSVRLQSGDYRDWKKTFDTGERCFYSPMSPDERELQALMGCVMPRTDDPLTPESGAVGGDFNLVLDCVHYR